MLKKRPFSPLLRLNEIPAGEEGEGAKVSIKFPQSSGNKLIIFLNHLF